MITAGPSNGDRAGAAIGAAAFQLLLAWALVVGLAVDLPADADGALRAFAVLPRAEPVPPERIVPPPPPRTDQARREGGSSPPNLRAQPTAIKLPPPEIRLPLPTIVSAPVPAQGSAPFAGNADIAGPGIGSGGRGTGSGRGFGPGDGDDGGGAPPRRIRGRIRDSDFPRWAWEAGIGGTVAVRYRVLADGRVTDCSVEDSSGSDALDDFTCRLIEQRFRFEPARDRSGRPVNSTIVENHEWVVEDLPPERDGR